MNLAKFPRVLAREDVVAKPDHVGEGFGIPAPSTIGAIGIFARTEAILLGPVHSGKRAAGLIDLTRHADAFDVGA